MTKLETVQRLTESQVGPHLQIVESVRSLQAEMCGMRQEMAALPEAVAQEIVRVTAPLQRVMEANDYTTLMATLRQTATDLARAVFDLRETANRLRQPGRQHLWMLILLCSVGCFVSGWLLNGLYGLWKKPSIPELAWQKATQRERAWMQQIASRPARPEQ